MNRQQIIRRVGEIKHKRMSPASTLEENYKIKAESISFSTFRCFPVCFGAFSPGSFLSNLPPLAVAVLARPAANPISSLFIRLVGVLLPVIGSEVAANCNVLHRKQISNYVAIS